ncbi:50S ribosomal protein L31e [Candidatus Micrarchaeota archaeon]|nr:50S ribosomal protein L31e [Candidatus Micrarchaeota archaeon]
MAEKLERIYTVPLGKAYQYVRTKRTRRAVKLLRAFIVRHMKADEEDIKLSIALNNSLWKRSIQKPPRRVKIRVIKEDGRVKAYLADEKIEEPKKEAPKKEEKPKEAPKEKPEEKKKEALKREEIVKEEAALMQKEAHKAITEEKAKTEDAARKTMEHDKNV